MTDQSVGVLVASRSPAYATGLVGFLASDEVEAQAVHTVDGALHVLARTRFAVVIIDERLADAPGRELADEIRRRQPDLRMLFALQGDGDAVDAQLEALAAGACGCILHTFTSEAVVDAVDDALRGVGRFDVDALRPVAELVRQREPHDQFLTEQERVVLRLMRQQLTYKEIAIRLGVSWHTVRTHAQSILRKHGVHSRRELDAWDSRRRSDEGGYRAIAG